jgi:nitroreductase
MSTSSLGTTFSEILYKRHSGRDFQQDKAISPHQIKEIIHAGHSAPSCFNDQPWRYIICDKSSNLESWSKLLSCLAEKNQAWANKCPVLVLVCAGTHFHKNDKPNRWGPYDTGASAAFMVLKATEMGLMVHQMGGFDEKMAASLFSIPEHFVPMSVMAIGHEEENKELPPRDRKPENEHFFLNAWGSPI